MKILLIFHNCADYRSFLTSIYIKFKEHGLLPCPAHQFSFSEGQRQRGTYQSCFNMRTTVSITPPGIMSVINVIGCKDPQRSPKIGKHARFELYCCKSRSRVLYEEVDESILHFTFPDSFYNFWRNINDFSFLPCRLFYDLPEHISP